MISTHTILLEPPPSIEFVAEDGRSFIVEPVTRARLEAAGAEAPLPEHELTLAEDAARRGRVLAALVGATVTFVPPAGSTDASREVEAAEMLGTLTAPEELRMIAVLRAQADGQDPARAAALFELAKIGFYLAAQNEANGKLRR
jgi:hypothetical protein